MDDSINDDQCSNKADIVSDTKNISQTSNQIHLSQQNLPNPAKQKQIESPFLQYRKESSSNKPFFTSVLGSSTGDVSNR